MLTVYDAVRSAVCRSTNIHYIYVLLRIFTFFKSVQRQTAIRSALD